MKSTLAHRGACAVVGSLVLSTLAVPATAANDPAGADAVAAAVADVAPGALKPVKTVAARDGHRFEGSEADVVLPTDPEGTIEVSGPEPGDSIGISLPEEVALEAAEVADDGTLVHESTVDSTDVAVQVIEDGSVRVETVIPDATAPDEYTYDIDLPAGATIRLEGDGGASFISADGEWLGGAAAPWAKDANGADVPTSYRVEGTALVQAVDLSGVTAYPVVADPWLGIDLLKSVSKVYRSEGLTLSVTPTAWGRANGNNAISVDNYVREYRSKVAYRYETTDMIWQLGCHAQFAPFKSRWNLDTWRDRSSYWAYVRNRCN